MIFCHMFVIWPVVWIPLKNLQNILTPIAAAEQSALPLHHSTNFSLFIQLFFLLIKTAQNTRYYSINHHFDCNCIPVWFKFFGFFSCFSKNKMTGSSLSCYQHVQVTAWNLTTGDPTILGQHGVQDQHFCSWSSSRPGWLNLLILLFNSQL